MKNVAILIFSVCILWSCSESSGEETPPLQVADLAQLHYRLEKWDSVYQYDSLALSVNQDTVLHALRIARALSRAKQTESATKWLQVSPRNKLDSLNYWCTKGLWLSRSSQLDSAAFYLDQVLADSSLLKEQAPDILAEAWAARAYTYYFTEETYDKEVFAYQQSIRIHQTYLPPSLSLAKNLAYIGTVSGYLDDDQRAEFYHGQAYQAAKKFLPTDHPWWPVISTRWAYSSNNLGYVNRSKRLMQEALDAYLMQAEPDSIKLHDSYFMIAGMMEELGESQQARQYYQACLALLPQHHRKYDFYLQGILFNLSQLFTQNGEPDTAFHYLHRAIAEMQKTNNPELGRAFLQLSLVEMELGKGIPGIHLDLAYNDTQVRFPGKSPRLIDVFLAKALLVEKQAKDYRLISPLIRHAIAISKDIYGNQHPTTARTYATLAEIASRKRQPKEAMQAILDAIHGLVPIDSTGSYQLSQSIAPRQLQQYFWQAGQYQLAADSSIEGKKIALDYLLYAQQLADSLRLDLEVRSAKLSLLGNLQPLFEQSLQTCWELWQAEKDQKWLQLAFQTMENSRALLLQESIQDLTASQSAAIPDSLLAQQQQLSIEKARTEIALQDREDLNKDSLRNRIIRLRQQESRARRVMEKTYPRYARLKYQLERTDVALVQQHLQSEQANVISYFMGQTNVFAMVMGPDQISMHQLGRPDSIIKLLQAIRTLLVPDNFLAYTQADRDLLNETSYQLYQSLIAPILPLAKQDRWIIIPDGPLSYLPFDVLLTEREKAKVTFNHLPFLLKQKRISQAFSSTLLLKGQSQNRQASAAFLGIAPRFGQTTGNRRELPANLLLADLPASREEVKRIRKLTDGVALLGEDARESTFIEEAAQHQVLHLATHAFLDDEDPLQSFLAFATDDEKADGQLFLYELFGLQLQAEMAVLSACNTGLGKMARGEGVISLGRGFAHAGVPSVVMSLWQVQDQSTAQIMTSFYAYLKDGLSKDLALQKAKLDYLHTASSFQSHPFFWAAFILQGKTKPIDWVDNGWF
ncbi:MAG: CHAT domain-containing protein [Bacteroidota bacterium]